MKTIIADAAWDGRRLTRFLQKALPAASMGQIARFLRLGRVKVDGRRGHEDTVLAKGQRIDLYVEDEWFAAPQREDPFYSKIRPKLTILYEDAHVMLLDKRPGLICHPDEGEKVHTLLTYAQAYLYQKGEYDPAAPEAFAPALCNRIDRFTGGIVIIAKNRTAMQVLNQKIRDREIGKFYYCIALGSFSRREGLLDNYIVKAPGAKRVTVSERMVPDGQRAQTKYRVLCQKNGLSLIECELLTGRTHQIRAQMAHAGHPLLGDSQYGDPRRNEKYGRSYQALYAYKLRFDFSTDAGPLNGLKGREFTVPEVRFIAEYFPEYRP